MIYNIIYCIYNYITVSKTETADPKTLFCNIFSHILFLLVYDKNR